VQFRGEGLALSRSSRQRVTLSQEINPEVTVPQSLTWLISLTPEGCRHTRSGNFDLSFLRLGFQSRESTTLTAGSTLGYKWRSTTPTVSWASCSASTGDSTGDLSEWQQGESLYSRSLRCTQDCKHYSATGTDIYVREWIRVFNTTLFVDDDREFIEFMLQGRHCRLTRERLAALLGVTHSAEPHSLHHLTYSDVEPPRRPHQPYPPLDEEASILFIQPFLPGTPRNPDRLAPLAKTIHLALRRSLLYRLGYNEGLTALQ